MLLDAVPDRDHDGVGDDADNCPDDANADQSDVDSDGVGDICDDCPLVSSPQGIDGDGDHVGDACDPHVSTPGDCLVLLDRFASVDQFAAHWEVESKAGTTPSIEPYAGGVRVTSDPTYHRVTMIAHDGAGLRFDGRYDVQMLANATLATSAVAVMTSFNDAMPMFRGVFCEVLYTGTGLFIATGDDNVNTSVQVIPTFQVGSAIRMLYSASSTTEMAACRVDIGIGVAATQIGPLPDSAGVSGFIVYDDPIDAKAVALYKPLGSCPTPIVR